VSLSSSQAASMCDFAESIEFALGIEEWAEEDYAELGRV
jgi:hypothetical protein